MAIALDPESKFAYIPEKDKGLEKEQQTVFQLKTLTARENASIQDLAEGNPVNGNIALNAGSVIYRTLLYGLKGWENFKDSKGVVVEWDKENSDKNFTRLLPELRKELAEAIRDRGELTGADRKN